VNAEREAHGRGRWLGDLRRGAALVLCLAAGAAGADGPKVLRYDLSLDLTATGLAGGLALLSSSVLQSELAPRACRVCTPNSLDASVRNALVWKDTAKASRWSNVLVGVLPIGLGAWDALAARAAGDGDAAWIDLLILAEAGMITLDLDQIMKYSVGRQRPYAYFGSSGAGDGDRDAFLSFFSSHTAFAFTEAAAAGTIARMRGYSSWPAVYAAGFAVSGTIGYLRIAADKHYRTDVIAGAAIGTAIGFAVPLLLHPAESGSGSSGSARVLPAAGGIAFVF
jgi:membrane-associated phospholipid phosphatase